MKILKLLFSFLFKSKIKEIERMSMEAQDLINDLKSVSNIKYTLINPIDDNSDEFLHFFSKLFEDKNYQWFMFKLQQGYMSKLNTKENSNEYYIGQISAISEIINTIAKYKMQYDFMMKENKVKEDE